MRFHRGVHNRTNVTVLVMCIMGLALFSMGCGGSDTTPTTSTPTNTGGGGVTQGLQVQNSAMSIWCTTRLFHINQGTLASNNIAYTTCPSDTGPVASLSQGVYEWWFEYDAGGPRLFTTSLFSTINAGQTTFVVVIIS